MQLNPQCVAFGGKPLAPTPERPSLTSYNVPKAKKYLTANRFARTAI
jgi:hypothetical protein